MDEKIKGLLTEIIKISPAAMNSDEDVVCFYCGSLLGRGAEHEADCAYVRLCRLLNIPANKYNSRFDDVLEDVQP